MAQTMHKKPEPLIKPPPKKPCPVCGHASYSLGGIHPQCNRAKADKVRREIRIEENLANPPEKPIAKKRSSF